MLKVLVFSFLFFFSCVSYHVEKKNPTPPILISINKLENDTKGYEIVFRVINNEYFFLGYAVFSNSNALLTRVEPTRNKGVFCTSLNVFPNTSEEYSIQLSKKETKTSESSEASNQNIVCKIGTELSSGNYLTMRSLVSSINRERFITYSDPSNTLKIP